MTATSSGQVSDGSSIVPAWPDLWEQDEHGPYLVGTRCAKCSRVALGMREICPHCLAQGESLTPDRIGRRGRLYSATTISQGPPGFDVPFRVGYVDLEEDVRIFAHVEQGEQVPNLGDEVVLTIQMVKKDEHGNPLTGPFYRNATGG